MPSPAEPATGSESSVHPFRGFYSPRTTPVPDNFFDEVLPELSGAEVKVLLYIFRRTFGWKKNSDNISLSQMVSGITKKDGTVLDRGTGLGKTSVTRALNQLVAKGMVRRIKRRSVENGDEPTGFEPVITDQPPVSQNGTRGVPKPDTAVSQNGTHKKQLDKTTVVKGSPLKQMPDLDLDPEQIDLIAADVVAALGDSHSLAYYKLVARKVPEPVIRQTLSEIAADGAEKPRALFTFRMHQYALKRRYGSR